MAMDDEVAPMAGQKSNPRSPSLPVTAAWKSAVQPLAVSTMLIFSSGAFSSITMISVRLNLAAAMRGVSPSTATSSEPVTGAE